MRLVSLRMSSRSAFICFSCAALTSAASFFCRASSFAAWSGAPAALLELHDSNASHALHTYSGLLNAERSSSATKLLLDTATLKMLYTAENTHL